MSNQSLRLSPNLCPSLTEEVYKKLKDENILNGIDLLSRNMEELAAKIRVSYKVLQNICKVVNAYHGAFQVSGLDLYNEALKSSQILPTGFDSLDKILGGGLLSEEILEVFGCSGSGKSTFCLTLSLRVALRDKENVIYIDPTHSISSSFVKEVLARQHANSEEVALEEALSRIHLFHPRDVWHLFAILEELLKEDLEPLIEDRREKIQTVSISEEDLIEDRRCRLLVIDSLPQLIFPLMGGSHFESFGILNHLSILMRSFVQSRKTPLVIVNNATKAHEKPLGLGNPELKPALGRFWLHVPHTRLFLNRIPMMRDSSAEICITKSTRLKHKAATINLH